MNPPPSRRPSPGVHRVSAEKTLRSLRLGFDGRIFDLRVAGTQWRSADARSEEHRRAIVTRGLLVDVSAASEAAGGRGSHRLTLEGFSATLDAAGLTLDSGDAVLLHVGRAAASRTGATDGPSAIRFDRQLAAHLDEVPLSMVGTNLPVLRGCTTPTVTGLDLHDVVTTRVSEFVLVVAGVGRRAAAPASVLAIS